MENTAQITLSKKKRRHINKYYPYPLVLVRQPDVITIRNITHMVGIESKRLYEGLPPMEKLVPISDTGKTQHKINIKLNNIPETHNINKYACSTGKLLGQVAKIEVSYSRNINSTEYNMGQLMKMNILSHYTVDKVIMVNMTNSEICRDVKIFMKNTDIYIYSKGTLMYRVGVVSHKTDLADIKLHNLPVKGIAVNTVKDNAFSVRMPLDERSIKIKSSKCRNSRSRTPVLHKNDETIKVKSVCSKYREPNYLKNVVKWLPDVHVYNANESKSVSFHCTGTEVLRLLEVNNKHIMQLLLKDLRTVSMVQKSNRITTFTLAFNLRKLNDYYDLHGQLKVESITEVNKALLPWSSSYSVFSTIITKQLIVIIVTICKFNVLCQRLVNSLATVVGMFVPVTVQNTRTPALMFQYWHFYNVAQGYKMKHLLDSSNVITLNTMREHYFVLILNPFPNLTIRSQCPRNFAFGSLTTEPYCNSSKSLSWTKAPQAKRASSQTVQPVAEERQSQKLTVTVTKSEILRDRFILPRMEKPVDDDEEDISSIYSVQQCHTDSEATVRAPLEGNSSAETVVHKLNDSYDFFVNKTTYNIYKICNWNYLTSKISITIPHIFQEKKNLILHCYSNYNKDYFISEIESAKDHYVNLIATQEFPKIFLKSVGKLLITTVFRILI